MAGFTLTRSRESFELVGALEANPDCDRNERLLFGNWRILTQKKTAVDYGNLAQGEGVLAAISGTMIFGEEVGVGALGLFLDTYLSDGLSLARRNAWGHYAVAIVFEDGRLLVVSDENSDVPVFFREDLDPSGVISTRPEHVAIADRSALPNAKFLLSSIPGPSGPFTGVRRLAGTEYLEAGRKPGRLQVQSILRNPADIELGSCNSEDEAAERYAQHVETLFSGLRPFGLVGVNTTGGVDTRTVLAGVLAGGVDPLLMYGKGNSGLTNTLQGDEQLFLKLSESIEIGRAS